MMIFASAENSYKARISAINKNIVAGEILSSSYKMPGFILKLYVSMSKGDRFDLLIEKCTRYAL